MGIRFSEGFGGNRVYNGSAWMELYHAHEGELTGNPAWSLTGNGKIPNEYSSILVRLLIDAVFDANTLDNSNNFSLSGGSWPAFNGSVNIPTVSSKQVYNNTVQIYPLFGNTYGLRAIASLSGIDRVPGTTSFDKWLNVPARAWAKPDIPTITGYSLNAAGDTATVTISGNQTNPGQDKYWQTIDRTIYSQATSWVETYGYANNTTSFVFSSLALNQEHRVGFRSSNEDGGVSAWTYWLHIYTKPAAPIIGTVKRKTTDLTKVDISWTIAAAYPGRHYIERRMTPADSWVALANVNSSVSTYTDTVATGTQPQYRVRTISYDSKIYSDYSAIGTSDIGSIKQYIPGVNEIYHGGEKITRVYYQGTMIWMS